MYRILKFLVSHLGISYICMHIQFILWTLYYLVTKLFSDFKELLNLKQSIRLAWVQVIICIVTRDIGQAGWTGYKLSFQGSLLREWVSPLCRKVTGSSDFVKPNHLKMVLKAMIILPRWVVLCIIHGSRFASEFWVSHSGSLGATDCDLAVDPLC